MSGAPNGHEAPTPPDWPPLPERPPEQLAFDFTLSPGAAHRFPDTSKFPRVPKSPETRA